MNFNGYGGRKIKLKIEKKIHFIKLNISNYRMAKQMQIAKGIVPDS